MEHLADEWDELVERKGTIFKYNALFLPIIHEWRMDMKKVVGCIILSDMPYESKTTSGEEGAGKAVNYIRSHDRNVILRQFSTHLNYFINMCILDMKEGIKEQAYDSVANLSKRSRIFAFLCFFVIFCFCKWLFFWVNFDFLAQIFKYGTDIKDILRNLRVAIATIFEFEDCNVLIFDEEGKFPGQSGRLSRFRIHRIWSFQEIFQKGG